MARVTMKKGIPFPMGNSVYGKDINIAVTGMEGKSLSLVLYHRKSGREAFCQVIPEEYMVGNVYGIRLVGIEPSEYTYNFRRGEEEFTDPYAKSVAGCDRWGERKSRGVFGVEEFDWEGDLPLDLAYEDIVIYLLHVRGFTRHSSSHVKYRGCFEGIVEKIPYLQELGINQIELMPSYDFDEIIKSTMQEKAETGNIPEDAIEAVEMQTAHTARRAAEKKINYWGYTDGFYFTPKAAYSGIHDSAKSFKLLVKECHKAGIEVMMQFYFPSDKNLSLILDCIRYWVIEYHIDGVHLLGSNIPIEIITTDPVLSRIKISGNPIPIDMIFSGDYVPQKKRLAEQDDSFMYDMRKFLKSDEDMLRLFASHQLCNPEKMCKINYMTNYYGFTMMDLVSYDRKHNEENGEDNRDGNDYNYSWNCGAEGTSRKKAVRQLRMKQIKNAFTMLFFSAGVPMLVSGDEFGRSQKGNNNSYCQDNEINWVNWTLMDKNREIFEFVKAMIALRLSHPIFHQRNQLRVMDYKSCGYPDISYHGEMAWYPKFENYNRHLGVMYCGEYGKLPDGKSDAVFYIAYNLYWQNHRFALPKLPKNKKWHILMDTKRGFVEKTVPLEVQTDILVSDRSVILLVGK